MPAADVAAADAHPVATRTPFVRRRLSRWLAQAALLAAVLLGVHLWTTRDAVSGAAPVFDVVLLDGRRVTLSDYRGRPLLVHFWATWCPICKAEQASIEALAGDHFNVVTVAMQSGTSESVARFMGEQKLNFPVLNDPDGATSASWGVHAVPASFIVDSDGKIRFVEIGFTTEVGLRLRLWLAQF